jgi:hypothetical protein
VIHHVGLEVREEHVVDEVAFWAVLGWAAVPIPAGIDQRGAWFERSGQQIHLQPIDEPGIPFSTHVAIVDGNIDETALRIVDAGYELLERDRHWGARRIFTRSPAGHRVELMAAPPL